MKLRESLPLALAVCLASLPARAQAAAPIALAVDLTDAPRKIFHAEMTMPVKPGPLTLVYPKWIPGDHAPSGPIRDLTGLTFRIAGRPQDGELAWRRDDVDMFALHLDVPPGVTSLDIHFDFLATDSPASGSDSASTSASLAMLPWNEVVLYPAGSNASQVLFSPSVKLPQGWRFATALTPIGGPKGDRSGYLGFAPVSLETLVDSPLLAGRYFLEIPLAPQATPRHYLDLAADGPEDLRAPPELVRALSNLVLQSGALFHSRHYNSYHFLVSLSNHVAHFGLEHPQSSDDRMGERTLIDPEEFLLQAGLLPHEFVHSWNGKYRRPAGLATPNYQTPMKGDLLWVYEGLTEYLGDVLTARSNLWSAEEFREALAVTAAEMDFRPGRTWRDLEDTAVAAQILYDASGQWENWRRSTDFYDEGELLWLEVDTRIRQLSGGRKSLDDFCARFHGLGGNTPPEVVPYTFDDVVSGLNAVQPYDWAGFFRAHLDSKAPQAPLNGIVQGGYRLSFAAEPTSYETALEDDEGGLLAWWSLGLRLGEDGRIADVRMGSSADAAGLGPGMRIVAADGRAYSDAQLRLALDRAKGAAAPMQLIVSNASYFKVVNVAYHGGQRYPYLERVEGAPDLLDEILKPLPLE